MVRFSDFTSLMRNHITKRVEYRAKSGRIFRLTRPQKMLWRGQCFVSWSSQSLIISATSRPTFLWAISSPLRSCAPRSSLVWFAIYLDDWEKVEWTGLGSPRKLFSLPAGPPWHCCRLRRSACITSPCPTSCPALVFTNCRRSRRRRPSRRALLRSRSYKRV